MIEEIEVIEEYDLEDQVNDLVRATGYSKKDIRRILLQQRRIIQSKLELGYGVNLKGIVKIMPKLKGNKYVLSAFVAQAVPRPKNIRKVSKLEKEIESNEYEDEELR